MGTALGYLQIFLFEYAPRSLTMSVQMNVITWSQLTPRQQHVLLLAIYVRNSLEDFHVKHLSNSQMKELNMLIRQRLYDVVSAIEDESDNQKLLGYLVAQIPDCWEIPSDDQSIIEASGST
jgi:hypothetical protein